MVSIWERMSHIIECNRCLEELIEEELPDGKIVCKNCGAIIEDNVDGGYCGS